MMQYDNRPACAIQCNLYNIGEEFIQVNSSKRRTSYMSGKPGVSSMQYNTRSLLLAITSFCCYVQTSEFQRLGARST